MTVWILHGVFGIEYFWYDCAIVFNSFVGGRSRLLKIRGNPYPFNICGNNVTILNHSHKLFFFISRMDFILWFSHKRIIIILFILVALNEPEKKRFSTKCALILMLNSNRHTKWARNCFNGFFFSGKYLNMDVS